MIFGINVNRQGIFFAGNSGNFYNYHYYAEKICCTN
jgi:hypothetical protein